MLKQSHTSSFSESKDYKREKHVELYNKLNDMKTSIDQYKAQIMNQNSARGGNNSSSPNNRASMSMQRIKKDKMS